MSSKSYYTNTRNMVASPMMSKRPATPIELKNHIKMIFKHQDYVNQYKSTKKDIERARLKKHDHVQSAYINTINDVKYIRKKLYNSRRKIIEKNTSYIVQ